MFDISTIGAGLRVTPAGDVAEAPAGSSVEPATDVSAEFTELMGKLMRVDCPAAPDAEIPEPQDNVPLAPVSLPPPVVQSGALPDWTCSEPDATGWSVDDVADVPVTETEEPKNGHEQAVAIITPYPDAPPAPIPDATGDPGPIVLVGGDCFAPKESDDPAPVDPAEPPAPADRPRASAESTPRTKSTEADANSNPALADRVDSDETNNPPASLEPNPITNGAEIDAANATTSSPSTPVPVLIQGPATASMPSITKRTEVDPARTVRSTSAPFVIRSQRSDPFVFESNAVNHTAAMALAEAIEQVGNADDEPALPVADVFAARASRPSGAAAASDRLPRSNEISSAAPELSAATLRIAAARTRLEALKSGDVLTPSSPHVSTTLVQPAIALTAPLSSHSASLRSDTLVSGTATQTRELEARSENTTQLVQAIRLQWARGGGEAHIQLEPSHFGEVTVSVRVEQGAVAVRLQAETLAVREWLQSQQHVLRQGLAEQQLALERLDISEPPSNDTSREREERPSPDRQQRESRRARRGDAHPTFELDA